MVKMETNLAEHCFRGRKGKPCVYLGKTGYVPTCDYGLITGELRRIPVEKCEH